MTKVQPRISRENSMESPYPLQNTDFSVHTVKVSIIEERDKDMKILQ